MKTSIVLHSGSSQSKVNGFYKMKHDDFRFNTKDYSIIGEIVKSEKRSPSPFNGHLSTRN